MVYGLWLDIVGIQIGLKQFAVFFTFYYREMGDKLTVIITFTCGKNNRQSYEFFHIIVANITNLRLTTTRH